MVVVKVVVVIICGYVLTSLQDQFREKYALTNNNNNNNNSNTNFLHYVLDIKYYGKKLLIIIYFQISMLFSNKKE